MIIFLRDIICVGANYNFLAIALTIFGINYLIKKEEKNNKYYIKQGIITLLIFMTKQNIGVYYFLALALCEALVEKHKIKNIIKNLLLVVIPVLLGLGTYCIYLYFDGALYNFIDYTFLGMKDFKQNFLIETYMHFLMYINIIAVTVVYVKEKRLDKNLKILFIFSMIMLLIMYPIVCTFHTKQALIFNILCVIYIINLKLKSKKTIEYILITIGLLYIIIITVFNIKNWITNHIKDKDDPYYGAIYNENADNVISDINKYMSNSDKKVVIVSPEAMIYNMRLKINNGILDYPVKGNVGINGQEKIINEIKNMKDSKFFIMKEKYYQEYQEVYDYIKSNYKNVGEIRFI